ncbi:DUF928 domain-containing protein [Oculatella sp. FACHB-28]|uniref:DUF928 domain-containing protein n=1 Tax=Cyanophyceae TaxID=3028117 RepID=UPI00168943F9|nr:MULTISPECIES: DUF928 domain-containing protein [Cyanophyceae]MBD1870814.1 DUF928 domain-containing protein [Cyanobacteria bacterium FACHB-471]MBD1998323.1 DUF928 domain-containing protein [Leptolyngbya sp. FACHB-541]MBD2056508.1 DUF928 domain-containing protein [Oculatella sp. FACHB-28]MBD2069081.1 DUF928 domain-containing protein [Leptolyngbya sp. FACHB-671]
MYRLNLNSKIRPIFVTICCAFSLGLVVGGFPLMAIAQEYNPPDVGLPGRREGGGTRGCWNELAVANPTQSSSQSSVEELPTALTPAENFGYTTSERPTFFFYIPQLYAEKAVAADFMLLDEQGNEVYSTTFQPSHSANVVSVTLPADSASALEPGKPYQWSFGLTCNLGDRSGDRVMDGWIQRVEPTAALETALANATPAELPALYAQSGIWYDAFASLVALHTTPTSQTFTTQWSTLLNSVGLNHIAEAAFAQCCTTAQSE